MRELYEYPPAFPFQPLTLQGEPTFPEYGMTLRDWFAGQCIVGYEPMSGEDAETLARCAYFMADAMLAARQGGDA